MSPGARVQGTASSRAASSNTSERRRLEAASTPSEATCGSARSARFESEMEVMAAGPRPQFSTSTGMSLIVSGDFSPNETSGGRAMTHGSVSLPRRGTTKPVSVFGASP